MFCFALLLSSVEQELLKKLTPKKPSGSLKRMSRIVRLAIPRLCLILFLLVSVVGCDQATKVVIRDTLDVGASLSYLGDLVRIEHAQNPGAFMSAGAALPALWRFWIFNIMVGGFLLALGSILFSRAPRTAPMVIGLALVLGGGLGNLIDRILYGSVTDFLIVGYGALRTGIFNIADMGIVLGIGLILINRDGLWPKKSSS